MLTDDGLYDYFCGRCLVCDDLFFLSLASADGMFSKQLGQKWESTCDRQNTKTYEDKTNVLLHILPESMYCIYCIVQERGAVIKPFII